MVLQWITAKMSNLFAISPLVFLIGLLSFQSNPTAVDLTKFSQDEIFMGIFFAEGAFADQIPELAKYNARNYAENDKGLQEALQFQKATLQKVKAQNPGYLPSLQQAVLSGQHIQIQRAIYQGVEILDNVIWTIDPDVDQEVRQNLMADLSKKLDANTSPDQVENIVDNYLEGIAADNPTFAKQLCVAVLVVVVAVAVGVFLWVVYATHSSLERTPLANEQIINAIAGMK